MEINAQTMKDNLANTAALATAKPGIKDKIDNKAIVNISVNTTTLEEVDNQKEVTKKHIFDEINDFKTSLSQNQNSFSLFDSNENFDNKFAVGNIPDGSIKNAIHSEIMKNTKDFQSILNKISNINEFDEFVKISTNIDSLLDSYSKFYSKIDAKFEERNNSIIKEINIIQITSAIGIASLFFVLVVIIFGKLIKSDEEVDQITQENLNILKSVKEGLFLISPKLIVGTQISQSTSKILERDIFEHDDFDVILQELVDEKTYIQAIDYIKILLTGNVKELLVQSLNPLNEIRINQDYKEKYLSMFFNRIKHNGEIVSLLVTIQDITKQVIISRELKEAKTMARKEIESILNTISQNKSNLLAFLTQMDETVQNINNTLKNLNDGLDYRKELNYIFRLVHKIKGEASTFGFNVFYDACHQFEDLLKNLLENENINGDLMLTVAVNLEGLIQKTNIIKKIINKSDIIDNNQPINNSPSVTQSINVDTQLNDDNIPVTFEQSLLFLLFDMNQKMSKDISLDLNIDLLHTLNSNQTKKVKDIIIQLLRNVGVHAFDKNNNGKVSISLLENNGVISLICKDNGKGINIEEIKSKIKSKYNVDDSAFIGKTEQQILSFIFKPGFSTAKEENMFGGRGVGLDLVAQLNKELSGKISLSTKVNQGTSFSIEFSKGI